MRVVKSLVFTNDYRVFSSPENPQLIACEELQETYTKNDIILIMLEPKSGDVFTPSAISAIHELTEPDYISPDKVCCVGFTINTNRKVHRCI